VFYWAQRLRFFDTTLRDGEQTPGVSLNPGQKLEIATKLSAIGVDVIEAGSAAASEGGRESIRLIAYAGLDAEICTYVRALPVDIDFAAEYGADSVHLVIPVSDLHIAKKMRKTREEVAQMVWDAVEYAKSRGHIVELSGEDASRADQEFLRKSVVAVADIRLEEYHVDAIQGGTDALVDITVRLSKDGKVITSRGARTDIIMASVEAMIAGMNRLLREEHENRGKNPR